MIMIIGLFGLSGTGKSHLVTEMTKDDFNIITIKASDIIRLYNSETDFYNLENNIVLNNQHILVYGLKKFSDTNPNKNIIIELHNIIETPNGIFEVPDDILDSLNLYAVCFLETSSKKLISQRKKDDKRVRCILPEKETENLQSRAKTKFLKKYQDGSIPWIILQSEDKQKFEEFVRTVIKKVS